MQEWDKGADYVKVAELLKTKIEIYSKKNDKKSLGILSKLVIYSIQLRNGSRISEALEAYYNFKRGKYKHELGKIKTTVKVRKKKKTVLREMILPEWIDITLLKKLYSKVSINSLKSCCKRHTGYNTHSLRYSYITYLLEKGINPAIVAKITKHSKLDMILKYAQEIKAKEALEKLG